jgi:hypothetical protein
LLVLLVLLLLLVLLFLVRNATALTVSVLLFYLLPGITHLVIPNAPMLSRC